MEKYSAALRIGERLERVRARIDLARRRSGRQDPVTLVAVGKTQPPCRLLEAYRLGVRHFGENYLQEALEKQRALGHCDITWHFIGPIQSNKTRAIATAFHWVHSVDRIKVARRLSEQRPEWMPPLNVCVQVNVSGEESKGGVAPGQLAELVEALELLPRLRLRGLMAIPAPSTTPAAQAGPLQRLSRLKQQLKRTELDTLSMGMSGDLEVAVEQGATLVRIGTGLFGPRR